MSQALTFQSHSVRVSNENGQAMFVAKDVCAALGIKWVGSKTLVSIPEPWKGVGSYPTPRGGRQHLITINEAATYKLAFRSNKPEADAFTNWVASEVLPAIRKTGNFEPVQKGEHVALPCNSGEQPFNEYYASIQEDIAYTLRVATGLFSRIQIYLLRGGSLKDIHILTKGNRLVREAANNAYSAHALLRDANSIFLQLR